jgi:hypothetical protein
VVADVVQKCILISPSQGERLWQMEILLVTR